MGRKSFDYSVENRLDNYINIEVGKRMTSNGGIKVCKADIIAEIANFADVGWENINRIKRGIVVPSLQVAMKIAQYFDVKVEDIFEIKDK